MTTREMPSLVKRCQLTLIRNIHLIGDVGDVPFRLLANVLPFATPDQLVAIVEANPAMVHQVQVQEMFRKHCRTFAHLRQKYPELEKDEEVKCPDEPSGNEPTKKVVNWKRVYVRALKERQEELALAKQKLKQSYTNLGKQKEARKIVAVEKPIPVKRSSSTQVSSLKGKPSLLRKALLEAKQATSQRARMQEPVIPAKQPASSRSTSYSLPANASLSASSHSKKPHSAPHPQSAPPPSSQAKSTKPKSLFDLLEA